MAKALKDLYVNRAYADVTMSAANTVTFEQLNFAVGVFQGVALKLIQVRYYPLKAAVQEIVAAADILHFGLTLRDDLANLDPTSLSVIDVQNLMLTEARTAESNLVNEPLISDFSNLPGGGLLLPANPIYAAAHSAGFAAAAQVRFLLYYVFVQLTDRESIELLQTIIPGNV